MAGKANLRKTNFDTSLIKNGNSNTRRPIKKGDARLKIIQKTRSKLVDARDRLAQMAKKTDARAKILKLRQFRTTGVPSSTTETVRPVGTSILMKTDRNGKISLSTNKVKQQQQQQSNSTPNINSAIRKELGLMSNQRKLPIQENVLIRKMQRTTITPAAYRNTSSMRSINVPNNNNRYPTREINITDAFVRPPVIKRTIRNDIIRELPPLPEFSQPHPHHPVEQNLYTWTRPSTRNHHALPPPPSMNNAATGLEGLRQSVEVTARNNLIIAADAVLDDWNYADPSIRSFKMSSMFIDEEENACSPPRCLTTAQRLKTGIHARLDTPPASTHSQGIFAQPKVNKVVVPVGHRIVVSNLQQTVTQDDIRELFEDIGELLVSRLVRPGTAEVIYKNLKDAQKAVDTYHNRQLDGQPMKCLLVNKRPLNNPTAPAVRPSKCSQSVLRTSGGITKKTVAAKASSNKLVPDISTIHKVLFHKT